MMMLYPQAERMKIHLPTYFDPLNTLRSGLPAALVQSHILGFRSKCAKILCVTYDAHHPYVD